MLKNSRNFKGANPPSNEATGVQPTLVTNQHRSTTGKLLSAQLSQSLPCTESSSYCTMRMLKSTCDYRSYIEMVAAVFYGTALVGE
eukprot:7768136-Heterocapsa_arctica.AAC.1